MSEVVTAVTYSVQHETRYKYSAPVAHAHHLLHLTPRNHEWQTTQSHSVELLPDLGRTVSGVDQFGNGILRVELDRPHQQFNIMARSELQVQSRPDYVASDTLPWERVRDELSYSGRPRSDNELIAAAFRTESPHVRIKNVFAEFAAECFPGNRPMLLAAEALMHKLHTELTYTPGATTVSTSLLAVLESRRGVCQDYSHLMIACLRSLGLSARYVSGYLRTVPRADIRADTRADASADAKELIGADASHAWVSVYVPVMGWVDLDPTNDLRVDTDHLTLGWGRDFSDVSPVRGVIVGGGQHKVSVAVTVKPSTSGSN